jgi:hypothetical protein
MRRIIESEHSLAADVIALEPARPQLQRLHQRLERIEAITEAQKDWATALAAAREVRKTLTVLARITGELQPRPAVEVNNGERLSIDVVFQLPDSCPGNIDNSAGCAIIDVSDASREVQPRRALARPKPN